MGLEHRAESTDLSRQAKAAHSEDEAWVEGVHAARDCRDLTVRPTPTPIPTPTLTLTLTLTQPPLQVRCRKPYDNMMLWGYPTALLGDGG